MLAVATSGVAAILLHGGRTAHSMFKLPIANIDHNSRCAITAQTSKAALMRAADLVIWDESPMANKTQMNCVDQSLRV